MTRAGVGYLLAAAALSVAAPSAAQNGGSDGFSLPSVDAFPTPRVQQPSPGPAFEIGDIVYEGVQTDAMRGAVEAEIESARALVEGGDGRWRMSDIFALRDAITRAYADAGFVNSGVQDPRIDGDVLTLTIQEGVLSTLATRLDTQPIFGGGGDDFIIREPTDDSWRPLQLRRSYVENRLAPDNGDPDNGAPDDGETLNVFELNERFQLLTNDPTIQKIEASLAPSDKPGEAALNLRVVEAPPLSAFLGFASERSPSVGGERGSATIIARNLAGQSDIFSATAGLTEGQVDVAAAYDLPVTRRGLTLHVYGDYSDAEIVEDPLSDLDILSEAFQVGAGVSHPIARGFWGAAEAADGAEDGSVASISRVPRPLYEFFVRGDVAHKQTETDLEAIADVLGETGFSFSPGAVDGETRLTVASLSTRARFRGVSNVADLVASANVGLDGTESPEAGAPDQHFFYLLAQGQYATKPVADLDFQIIVRGDAQYAPGTLYSAERFSFGGIDSVRGYRANQVTADSALVGSIETRFGLRPLGRRVAGRFFDDWSIGAFVDGGLGWNAELADPVDDALLSAGVQLNVDVLDRLSGSVYYGRQLVDVTDPEDDMFQDSGVGFRLVFRGLP